MPRLPCVFNGADLVSHQDRYHPVPDFLAGLPLYIETARLSGTTQPLWGGSGLDSEVFAQINELSYPALTTGPRLGLWGER
jgi:hypothetical protein